MSDDNDEKDLSEVLNQYVSEKRMRFEGDSGLDNLNTLIHDMSNGEYGHQYKYGSPLESFLSDNPGAVEALMEWIAENDFFEAEEGMSWKSNLESCLNDNEDEDNESLDSEVQEFLEDKEWKSNERYVAFVKKAFQHGVEVRDYRGRFFYHGPAVELDYSTGNWKGIPCRSDNLGLGFIIYPT